ncbi:hypothetical protein SEUCBS140593_007179 [Sporothrix eucalyptigena]|uniref:Oleate hydratase n=1 Tax=Sporothrix eucalyptigena TaxID=1812306 RepID=A0ABP0CBE7_9PEZI
MRRPPQDTHAYLVGGGIASLTAAVHLVYDAGVPANQIHIIEASPRPGGSMGRVGGDEASHEVPIWKKGYSLLAARKLNFSYRCLYDTLAKVPSARHPGRTVLDDVKGSPEPQFEADNETSVTATAMEDLDIGAEPVLKAVGEASSEFEFVDVPTVPATPRPASPQAMSTNEIPKEIALSPSFPARLVARGDDGRPQIVNVQSMGLLPAQRMSLLGLILTDESTIAGAVDSKAEIQAYFQPDFFESKFWDVWASLYAFQPWHSAVEFRRYLLRFLHEFAHISTLAGIDHAPLNDYECIILPMEQHLQQLGVDFRYATRVEEVIFNEDPSDVRVTALKTSSRKSEQTETTTLGQHDIVFLTLGSMTAGVRFGGNGHAPPPLPPQDAVMRDPGPVWRFWERLANPTTNPVHHEAFGRPSAFYSHIAKSSWLSFTVTLSGAACALFTHLANWAGFGEESHSTNSNGPLITFRDSPWMMSITMPHQPYFTGQPDDVRVLWGYGLYPDQEGLHVHKPMMACTGTEIFAELLSCLDLPPELSSLQKDGAGIVTIPCLMPFIGSPFLTRTAGDRPDVLPESTPASNLGLLGQFVEIDRDVTFTMEYSARSAQLAVYGLMGLDGGREPPPVHRSDQDVQVLGEMLMTIMS